MTTDDEQATDGSKGVLHSRLLNTDLVLVLVRGWHSIERRYKQAFLSTMVVNLVVYLVFVVHQPMHSHGILSRLLYMSSTEQVPAGRWFSVVVLTLFNSMNLMVLLPLVVIALHVVGGMLAVSLWYRDASALQLGAGALLVSLYPPVMTSFDFAFVGPVFSGPHVLAPLALLAASSPRILSIAAGAGITCVMMATYQPGLSIIAFDFSALALVRTIDFRGSFSEFLGMARKLLLPRIASILIGVLSYQLSLTILSIAPSETTATLAWTEIPAKALSSLLASLKLLFLTQPELLRLPKLVLLAVVVSAVATLLIASVKGAGGSSKVTWRTGLVALLMVGALLSTKAMYLVSANADFENYRYNHATGYLYMFAFVVLLRHWPSGGVGRNVVYLALFFTLLRFAYADIGRQQVLLRAQTHHLAIANRILSRIESLPGLDPHKEYRIVRVGVFSDFQNEQLRAYGHDFDLNDGGHLGRELSPIWGPGDIFKFLGSGVKLQGYMNPRWSEDLVTARGLLANRKSWPSPDSVFVHEDMIVVYLGDK